jgi:hypothetical protein
VPYYGWYAEDGLGGPTQAPQDELIVFDNWESGSFHEASRLQTSTTSHWMGNLRPVGDKLLFDADNGLGELDTTNPAAPVLTVHDLYGYGCWNLTTHGNQAMCAMGEFGMQVIDL